jgi:5-methylcytosine-specific restriction enzyme subunit McrC
MSMQLCLTEYETKRAVALTPTHRDQLQRLAPSVTVVPTVGCEGAYDLTPGSFVGVVHLDDALEVVISPKLPIERVLFLISYAIGQGRWLEAPAALGRADSLVEAIVRGFTYQLRRALERGVLQDYRAEDDALTTVRGRWRVGDQIRTRFGIVPPIEVTYDDFTEDIELNRLLRGALHRLLRLSVRDDRSRWPLRALDPKLSMVRLVDYDPHRVPQVALDRRSERYRGAVNLARLILTGVSFDLTPGEVGASAFLIDMNKVFEDFLVVALRDALGVSDRVLVQGASGKRLFLDTRDHIALKPDISLWKGGVCLFVGDAKYKRIRPDAYPNADLYQLTAYTIATGLPSGTLVYAAGEEGATVHEVIHAGKRLHLVALDLTVAPEGVLTQIAALASRIRKSAVAA